MIEIIDKKDCCGCFACMQACPKNAITRVIDEFGFTMPKVDSALCISCGKCDSVCPIKNAKSNEGDHTAYCAYAKDKGVRFNCSSGGMVGVLSNYFFSEYKNDAVVYGACFDNDLKLKLTPAYDSEQAKKLYKSKYVESYTDGQFVKIKGELDGNKRVLFVSSPCQVKALKLFLGKEYDNLITVDFICHGVPSQNFFDRCISYQEKKENIKITDYSFRTKIKRGATPHYYTLRYIKGGKQKVKTNLYLKSPFYLAYQKYLTLRDSCYDCKFAYTDRPSDITVCDFHTVEKYLKGINRFDGVSLFTVNSKRGADIFERIKNSLEFTPVDFALLIENKEYMSGATKMPKERQAFLTDLKEKDFSVVVERYFNPKKEWKKAFYYKLPNGVRKVLKKIKGI